MVEGLREAAPMNTPLVVNLKTWPGGSLDYYIGRPSSLGNPFSHRPGTLAQYRVKSRKEAIERYRAWLLAKVEARDPEVMAALARVTPDTVLTCWCVPQPCHGQVIVEVWDRLRRRNL